MAASILQVLMGYPTAESGMLVSAGPTQTAGRRLWKIGRGLGCSSELRRTTALQCGCIGPDRGHQGEGDQGYKQMLTLASACLLVDREAKFRRLLKEALESGMLAAKVGILKHPGKAGSMSESGSALSSPMCRSLLRHRGNHRMRWRS